MVFSSWNESSSCRNYYKNHVASDYQKVGLMKKGLPRKHVTLVNMNVWFGMDARGYMKFGEFESGARRRARFKILAAGLKDLQPDVIGIQEANTLPDYANNLAGEIGYDAVWKTTNSGIKFLGRGIPTNFAAGNVIMSPNGCGLRLLGAGRLSGKGCQLKNFSFHFTELRDVIAAMTIIRDQPIIIFNTQTHFSVIWNQRWEKLLNRWVDSYQLASRKRINLLNKIEKSQARRNTEICRLIAFVKKITTLYDYPFVIMGDFNDTADSPEMIHLVDELNLQDAYRVHNPDKAGYTWDPARNTNTGCDASLLWADGVTPRDPLNRLEAQFDAKMARRIDFIFLSYQFEPNMVRKADLIFTEPTDGLFASDHFGLQVVLDRLP